MDFASILRAFLRQDPDVILVGETRDSETAKTAIEAALTGHLVLTTLHTNDAAGAIARLDEMGVEPFMISGALVGVLAQRLMRRVCGECRIAYNPSREELSRFGLSVSAEEEVVFYKANKLDVEQISQAKANGSLCRKCIAVLAIRDGLGSTKSCEIQKDYRLWLMRGQIPIASRKQR